METTLGIAVGSSIVCSMFLDFARLTNDAANQHICHPTPGHRWVDVGILASDTLFSLIIS